MGSQKMACSFEKSFVIVICFASCFFSCSCMFIFVCYHIMKLRWQLISIHCDVFEAFLSSDLNQSYNVLCFLASRVIFMMHLYQQIMVMILP